MQDIRAESSLLNEYNALKRKSARREREYENLLHLYKQAVAMRDYNEKEKEIQMRYNQMLRDNSPDDLFLLDAGMNILLYTSSIKKRMDRDVTGEQFLPIATEAFGEDCAREIEPTLRDVLLSGESRSVDAHVYEHSSEPDNKKELFFSFRISPALDSKGNLTGVVVLAHDNTEMHHANIRAESAARAKSKFLANMSHEIRTPLNAIIGMTQIGLASDAYQKTHYCLEKISVASKQLLSLINDVLDISKIEADRLELSISAFDIKAMLESLLSVHAVRADEKSIALRMVLDDGWGSGAIAQREGSSRVRAGPSVCRNG
jgi:signal transduction histidine kinase